MRRRLAIPATMMVTVLAAACGSDQQQSAGLEQQGSEGDTIASGRLSPEAIARLAAMYPVLGEEPAPEPRPGAGSAPGASPGRIADGRSPRVLEAATGQATYYADHFEGNRTASGIPFRQNQMVAAHRSFPFGTLLRVTHAGNDRSVNVRVVDRGPFGSGSERPIIDLSRRAAAELGFVDAGRAAVRVEVLEWGEGIPQGS